MSDYKKLILMAVILAGLVALGLYYRDNSAEKTALRNEKPKPLVSASASASPLVSDEKPVISPQAVTPPSVSKLREEVQKDVHATPPSLIRFGAGLGVRMKAAKKDQTEAAKLMIDLRACAVPAKLEESPVQARALCLVNARQLAATWPDLGVDAQDIADHADPEAVQLANRIK